MIAAPDQVVRGGRGDGSEEETGGEQQRGKQTGWRHVRVLRGTEARTLARGVGAFFEVVRGAADCSSAQKRAFALPGFPLRPGERVEEARRGACTDARAFVVGTGCAVNEPRNPLAQSTDRMSGDRDARVPFLLVPFLWAHTAPQERRERRSRPEGRRAGCPESRKGTRSPPRRAEPLRKHFGSRRRHCLLHDPTIR